MWLLLIEDEKRLGESLKRGLEEEGYTVDLARDGYEGEEMALNNAYDVLLVDWRLPRKEGKEVVKSLREAGRSVPIIMLTALADIDHRIEGLDAGADDYMPKPFSFEELLARLRALLRRPALSTHENSVRLSHLVLDLNRRKVTVDDSALNLRPKEYALLELLLRHPGEVLTRTLIAERVWGDAFYLSENALDVTVSGLRQKLADAQYDLVPPQVVRLETIRGVGYRLALDNPT